MKTQQPFIFSDSIQLKTSSALMHQSDDTARATSALRACALQSLKQNQLIMDGFFSHKASSARGSVHVYFLA